MNETATDAEALEVELFAHCWLSPVGAAELRTFLADRARDEITEAIGRRALGDRGDLWCEVRRLIWFIDAVDSARSAKSRDW